MFQFGDYTVAVLFGLLFPLLITLSWGWKYGLLSALAGGCQSMWSLWGPSNGWAVFPVVIPFTFWILWHGIFASLRRRTEQNGERRRLLSPYLLEIPFRLLNSINLLTLSRWAVSKNPPPWDWGANAQHTIPMEFSIFVAIKQASVAYLLLLLADVLLNIKPLRKFFKMPPLIDQSRTGYVVSISLLLGCLFWFLDSIFFAVAVAEGPSFIDLLVRDIPGSNLFTRVVFLVFCLAFGTAMSRILRKQKEDELTLRKTREEALTQGNFLRAIFQTLPDLIWLKDVKGTYLACNTRVEALFGRKESEIVGKTDYEITNREQADLFHSQDEKVMQEKQLFVFQVEQPFDSDGHSETIETIKAPMYDERGAIMGVVGIGRNITERAGLQKQLVQARKMESVGRLAGGVAHDFNNMLTVILGFTDIIMETLPEESPIMEEMAEIRNAAERSEDLTRQLLAFARKQAIAPRVVNINGKVESLLKMLRRLIGENIELIWHPGEELWNIKADPAQIDQILANLCVNARDAIENTGTLTISTENTVLEEEYCSLHEDFYPGEYVKITISDSGCGISKEIQENIFDPFYTTKQTGEGTGLGLSMVYGIMKQHQGFIYVYSEPGKGTTFKLYFPRQKSPEDPEDTAHRNTDTLIGGETILLVEDEPSILKVMQMQLQKRGYRILAFSNPKEAVESSRRQKKLDLLLTDVVMPDLNGKELTHEIRKLHPDIKCLYTSGYTADVITRHGILDKGVHLLNKPFPEIVLARKVREVLDNGEQ